MTRKQIPGIDKKTVVYLKDVYDDVIHLIDNNERLRTSLSSVIEIHLSNLSNNTNEIMKTLTIIASFAMVPTLIASIYGMNFRFMPEIPWLWGYPFALGLMAVSVFGMYAWFKKKGWM